MATARRQSRTLRTTRFETLESRHLLNGDQELVKDIFSPPASTRSNPTDLVEVNGALFFAAKTSAGGYELWKSDGSANGTVLVKDINPNAPSSNPYNLVNVNGTLFFSADNGTDGYELWKSDGTPAGTVQVKDINGTGDSNPKELTNVNGVLFFRATGADGTEVWKSNGTAGGTVQVKDILEGNGSSVPYSPLANINGTLYFSAHDGTSGFELWKSNGTSGGTVRVKDIVANAGSSGPANFTNVNGTLFFSADNGTDGNELWKSNGTAAGTTKVKDINSGNPGSYPQEMANIGGTLFFSAVTATKGRELWKSTGTSAGTVLVKDIYTGSNGGIPYSGYPRLLTNVNGTLYFKATNAASGTELWKSNGTSAGTTLVKNILVDSASGNPFFLTNVQGTLFFRANAGVTGFDLMKSNGTSAGTEVIPSGESEDPNVESPLVVVGNRFFYAASTPSTGTELFKVELDNHNLSPVVGKFGASISYAEDGAAVAISSGATIADSDSSNFNLGTLVARVSQNAHANDVISISNAGNVTTNGSNQVLVAGVVIGTFTGGVGTNPLTITWTPQASVARVQAVLRSLQYRNTSNNPGALPRTIEVTLNDGDGGTSTVAKTINIAVSNDAPALGGISGNVGYSNAGAAVALASSATLTDVDSLNFNGGKLTIQAVTGAHSSNRIELGGTLFTLDGNNNVKRDGVTIGKLNANGGVGSTKFEVTFNASATSVIVQQLLRAVRFRTINSASDANRVLSFKVTDGDGGTSATANKTVVVN